MKTKRCPYCEIEKPVDEFTKNPLTKDGLKYECRICSNERKRQWHIKNKEQENKKDKANREKFKIEHGGLNRDRVLRSKVLSAYGGKCVCCGEDEEHFLSLDHVNGGGNKHIKNNYAKIHYVDAKNRNYPPDYRVLCYNCNFSLGHYGFCPHQVERGDYERTLPTTMPNVSNDYVLQAQPVG